MAEKYDADFTYPRPEFIVERGEGALLFDADGHEVIDLGEIIANIGHCHPYHVNALQKAVAQMITGKGNSMINKNHALLVKKLVEITPQNLQKVFLATSGGEIIDWAIRIVRRASKKHEIMSFWNGVYGRSYGGIRLNGVMRRKKEFGPLMPGVIYAPYAYCYRCPFEKDIQNCQYFCISYLDRLLEAESTNALSSLFVEPYQGVGGLIFPPDGYLSQLEKWAKERNILFVLDEMQSSFGRTGKMFALEWENLKPDILCLGKGMGGGISIAALVATTDVMQHIKPGEMSGGNGGNHLAVTSALTVIEILEKEKLAEHAFEIGNYLLERFKKMQKRFPAIGDVRGKGLSLALEFVVDPKTKEPDKQIIPKLSEKCFSRGVLLPSEGYILGIRPPLVITLQQAEYVANVIEESLEEMLS